MREFSDKELEMFFTDRSVRDLLINFIKEYDSELSDDAVINLALEYFLENLEIGDSEIIMDDTKQTYIMSKYLYIEKYILKEEVVQPDFTPETVRDDMLDIDFDENRDFVDKVIKRDGKCLVCGGRDNLEVHNVFPLNYYPCLGLEPGSVFTLCHECHENYHKRYSSARKVCLLTLIKFKRRYEGEI